MKDTIVIATIITILTITAIVALEGNKKYKAEIKDLNRQLHECQLSCSNKEMIEVLDQCLSPLTMDELRLAAEQLKQQKLRQIFKQREEQSNEN